jgi:hypothetical protein
LRRRNPQQDGPLNDVSIPLKLNEDPIKSLYEERGDKFEQKVLVNATAHFITHLNHFTPKELKRSKSKVQGKKVALTTPSCFNLTVSISSEEVSHFREAYKYDPHFKEVLEVLTLEHDPLNPPFVQYKVGVNGLLYFCQSDNYRLCVPKTLQQEIVANIHDQLPETAHAGTYKGYNAVASTYYWKDMLKTIQEYVLSCDICQKAKPKHHGQRGFLQPIPIPVKPFDVFTMDFIMDLPPSHGYNAILTLVDKLTKYVMFIPCKTTLNEEETAKLVHNHVWMHYGLPRQIITDRDARWTGSFWEHLTAIIGIKRSLTTAYHPQADGQSEIMNQILETALRCFTNPSMDNWTELLPGFTFAYNTSTHTSTGFSPAYLLYGIQPLKPSDLLASTSQTIGHPSVENTNAETFAESMKAVRQQAIDSLTVAQAQQVKYYNKGRDFIEFEPGDLVLVNAHSLHPLKDHKGKGRKLLMRYEGPFEVNQQISDVTYRIALPASYKIHPVINIAHLEPYKKDSTGLDRPKKHLDHKDFIDEPEFEVENIIGEKWFKCKHRRIKKYHVKWLDYGPEWNSWLTKQQLTNAPELLQEWERKKRTEKSSNSSPDASE